MVGKRVTPNLHVAGGLTERQLKYAYDGGFKGIISLFAENYPGEFGGEPLATESEAKNIANVAGYGFESVLKENEDWASLNSIKKLSEAINRMPKPILLYSTQPEKVAFATLMHLAYLSKKYPSFSQSVNSEKLYKMSAVMGLDVTSEKTKAVVAEITGEPIVKNPPTPVANPSNWLDYSSSL